jgi:CHAT domain-containing protein
VVVVGMGLVTACITSENITFNVQKLDAAEQQQFTIDEKLLSAAVHSTNQPSADLDSEFPAQSSYRLYQIFFGSVGTCLKNKDHILLATDPDFFALPWNAMLTKEPLQASGFSFRGAPWLPRSYSISLLPSVQSLYELRTNFPGSAANSKFLGIGDPDFKGTTERSTQVSLGSLFSTRGAANLKAIAELPPLPESADELRAVAHALGAPTNDLLLGFNASEREFRKRPLNDYRVISFATHAIVAGEIEGVTEPALVLSPGQDERNPRNDGLLTASEIANLTLDANLVILSACDTAASDGHASGRGLSGLADAFFFAGTRSLAVTQWAVASTIAQRLGAGLISRTMASNTIGVAEGLREAMLDYIATAKEDYLANPRFWGAFIIAGDGAVRPLDGMNSHSADQDAIHLDWQRVMQEPSDSEFVALAKVSHRSLYAQGIEKPPAGEKRAGSYIAQLAAGDVRVVSRDRELATSGLMRIGDDLAVLGFIPAGNKSTAVFQLLNKESNTKWAYKQDGPTWNFPGSAIHSSEGYVLSSVETNLTPGPSTLILTLVSEQGATIRQRRYPISIGFVSYAPRTVSLDSMGNLVIAIAGTTAASPFDARMWTNPLTGTKKFCTSLPQATLLFSIDPRTFELRDQKIVQGEQIIALRESDGHLYAAFRYHIHCKLDTYVKLVELAPDFQMTQVFQSQNVNSIDVTDLAVAKEYFVLVGGIRTFLPTTLVKESPTLEQLKNYQAPDVWSESFWEKTDEHTSAIVLIVGKDGVILGSRLFPDVLYRRLSNVIEQSSDHFVAVGSAFGDRGWAIGFTPADSLLHTARPLSNGSAVQTYH